ncbi:hypothetical protein [Endozoicomonas sp.]|uniref:hypothetical protein n=1 Tax=Endozoicomonas sp. TaxID=1892382 RepID=UPI003AF61CC9
MDILSTSLATLITSMSGNMTDSYVENVNSQLTPVVIEHQGHDIYFKHHLWKIRSNSVCQNKRHKITEFSQCTIAAKSAFNEVCKVSSGKNFSNHKAKSMVRMYCQAASTFQPTIASIQSGSLNDGSTNTQLRQLKQQCSMLTLESQESYDPTIESKRAKVCSEYKRLSDQK